MNDKANKDLNFVLEKITEEEYSVLSITSTEKDREKNDGLMRDYIEKKK